MISFNPSINPVSRQPSPLPSKVEGYKPTPAKFTEQIQDVGKALGKVDDMQQASDASIADLLAGKSADITSVVSSVAKADMSFKLLVGVRNKLIEAYKQTMNMPL